MDGDFWAAFWTFAAAIVTAASLIGGYFVNKRIQRDQAVLDMRLKHLKRQLEELYEPVCARILASEEVWHAFRQRYPKASAAPGAFKPDPPPPRPGDDLLTKGDQRYSSTELKLQPSTDSSPTPTMSYIKHLSQRLRMTGKAQATQLPEPQVCPPQAESEALDNFFWGLDKPTAEDMAAYKLFNQVVFYPLSREIAGIIYQNIHLLATDKHEDYHYILMTRYCAHVLGDSVVFHLWGKEDAGEAHPFGDSFPRDLNLFLFPVEFVTYFQHKRQELRAQYLQLLQVRTQGGRGANIRLQTWEEYMTRLRRQQAASAEARSPDTPRQTSTAEPHLTNVSTD